MRSNSVLSPPAPAEAAAAESAVAEVRDIDKPNKAPNGTSLRLNAFHLTIQAPDFEAFAQAMGDNKQLKGLRESIGKDWFLTWKEGTTIPPIKMPVTELAAMKTPATSACRSRGPAPR